jgi:hypothetical protein
VLIDVRLERWQGKGCSPASGWRGGRGRGARRRPAGEVAEEGGRPVGEVAGVRVVLGEAPVGPGNGRSDPSTWMASSTLSTMVCTRRVNGVRAGGRH